MHLLRFHQTVVLLGLSLATGVSPLAWSGVPEELRLDNPVDAAAFQRWFTFLAEAQLYNNGNRPEELVDCSSLLRYAYREALRKHDSAWARGAGLPVIPALPSVKKYNFPRTPVGPNLFRVRAGDSNPGAFSAFADVKTLKSLNTFFVSRDVQRALPGDLLFYRRDGRRPTYHSMIFLGRSQFETSGTAYVIYHTGPEGATAGEIRRRSIGEMLRFPEPEWRPTMANPSFLGVFRWNILE